MVDYADIGKRIRACRLARGMTQEQLAMLLGVSRQAISKWESEKAYPEMDKLLMLCDMFGVTLDDLVMGDVRASAGCGGAGRVDLAADTDGVAASVGVADAAVGAVPGVIGFAASQVAGMSDSGESDNQSGAGTGADAGSASASSADAEYRSLLDSGGGVMGTIRIPKISVRLPIYHGTSESALASGAGHLYGSSLPVGGKSTHAVLTGHRGLVEAAMFTRLDEMRVGDYFYIEVMGRTLGYQVDRITVIEPNDTSQLKIVPGEDRVTLMTCTPYGVNTHRLLVSATRSAIPDEIPAENDAVKDARAIGAITGIATLVVGVLLVWLRRKPWHIRRHAAWWPKRG